MKPSLVSLDYATMLIIILNVNVNWSYAQKEVEESSDLLEEYSPGMWIDPYEPFACRGGGIWPRYGTFNEIGLYDQIPIYSYPMKYSTFTGLNDTIQVQINWINYTDEEYSFKEEHPETWFVPRVFRTEDFMATGLPWKDSTELGCRVRGWVLSRTGGLSPTPDAIPKRMDGGWFMLLDVWNLPEGHYSLCIDTTTEVPDDFIGRPGGDNYHYYAAHDLADTINAYEAIFRRALTDSNFEAAKNWVDKMLLVNPTSVPGWWLRATYYSYLGETTETIAAYDSAITYWETGADPAMPDSTKRVLLETEKKYVDWCGQRLKWERSSYAP